MQMTAPGWSMPCGIDVEVFKAVVSVELWNYKKNLRCGLSLIKRDFTALIQIAAGASGINEEVVIRLKDLNRVALDQAVLRAAHFAPP